MALLRDINSNRLCPEPFRTHHGPVTVAVVLKFGVVALTLFPLRLLAILAGFIIHTVGVQVALIGAQRRSDLPASCTHAALSSPWRYACVQYSGRIGARLLLWGLGFWYIPTTVPRKLYRMPAVVVCNHVSYIDILYFIASSCPIAFVSKDGVRKVPLVGTFAQTYTSLFVDRSDIERHVRTKSYDDSSLGDASSRSASFHGSVNESVKDAIRERIETVEGVSDELGRYVPRIVIFPEGTTTNNKYLLKFKRGAFQPLKPVQPVLLRYSFSNFDPSYLRTTFGHLLAMMCQLYNSLSVEWMEPMKPSRTVDLFASPADRMLAVDQFADEVCSAMAARLRVPVSDATVLEKRDFMINIFWPSKGKGNGLAAAMDENDKTE